MIGERISYYRLLQELGSGGMGNVYKAEDLRQRGFVAIKILSSDLTKDEEALTRFEREARAAASLNHPNIISVYDITQSDDYIFIVMEFIAGDSLRKRITQGPLVLRDIISFCYQIGDGLSEAHQAGIIHRDIKPENILIGRNGIVKIIDFGLAKLRGAAKLAKTGEPLGTIPYMSPEQIQGMVIDQRSDIWSLGILLYEMLTCELPFKGTQVQSVMNSILHDEQSISSILRHDIPKSFDSIVNKTLQKDPSKRYDDMPSFLNDLTQLIP